MFLRKNITIPNKFSAYDKNIMEKTDKERERERERRLKWLKEGKVLVFWEGIYKECSWETNVLLQKYDKG